jgi:nitrogenase molybdenum-cofactor synthesis protein NifE
MTLIRPHANQPKRFGVNILGDYNLAGEMWIIKGYLEQTGIPVISTITGDSSCEKLINAPAAALNIVQCAGSSAYLAERMSVEMGIPYVKVSFFGIQDTAASLLRAADALGRPELLEKARQFASARIAEVMPVIEKYRPRLEGKKAAVFVGGGFKAISLIRQFNELGMKTVVVGTQTGKKDEYEIINSLVDEDAVVLDDANPAELERFMLEKQADILVGGVKERPLAYKLGVAFCDHNHERRHPLAGFEGIENFVKEIHKSINSPVWKYVKTHYDEADAV